MCDRLSIGDRDYSLLSGFVHSASGNCVCGLCLSIGDRDYNLLSVLYTLRVHGNCVCGLCLSIRDRNYNLLSGFVQSESGKRVCGCAGP